MPLRSRNVQQRVLVRLVTGVQLLGMLVEQRGLGVDVTALRRVEQLAFQTL
jgi:hypothetical protein